MHMIVVLVLCGIISLVQPVTEATWPELWFQATSVFAPNEGLLDFLREVRLMDRGTGFMALGAEGPLREFDLGPPVMGAEIVGARSNDCQTSSGATDGVARKGAALPSTVIVADDFGLDAPTTGGILQAFDEGLISATSLLANMPGFDQAVAAAHDRRLHGAVGVHLNLTEGTALTEPVRRCPRIAQRDGTFCWTHHFVRKLERDEAYAVGNEWRAQIARIVAAGIRPAHVDSHHHTHTSWPFGAIAMALAREFGIPTIRLSRTFSARPSRPHLKLYKLLYNGRLRARGFSTMAHFGDVRDVPAALPFARGPIEVMTHPRLADNGELINHTGGGLLAPYVDQAGLRGAGLSYGALLKLN
jgi:chitin disaccharide deacetylase